MASLAREQGFKPITPPLLTADATAAKVIKAIKKAAESLEAGGTFFITYAGHGSQVPDINGDEADRMDETWCLYDRMLVDDELALLWAGFRPGVRIVMLSDSCHSGSVSRAVRRGSLDLPVRGRRPRMLSMVTSRHVYRGHKGIYDAIQRGSAVRGTVTIEASVLLISGCQDNQLSGDGDVNGLFTETLKFVWAGGAFNGSYQKLRDEVAALMPRQQQPRYSLEGAANLDLELERPFSPAAGMREKEKVKAKVNADAPPAKEKSSKPLAFILAALKLNGLAKPTASSDLRAWIKAVEKEDTKLGLPASRADAFLASCFEQFPKFPLEKADITKGDVRTPKDIVNILTASKRRSRGGNDNVRSFSGVKELTTGVSKEVFLSGNKAGLDKIIAAVNVKLTAAYGGTASLMTRHDLCVVFYCECGLKAGKVDPDHTHSEGERGMLPLPSNIKSWNGQAAPAWDQPMSAVINAEHFFLYMGHLKNKDLTGPTRHLYQGLFNLVGISGDAAKGSKMLAGVVHGYFYSGNYSDKKVPYDHLVKSYQADAKLSEFMAGTTYVHAGTAVLTGREKNINVALGLV